MKNEKLKALLKANLPVNNPAKTTDEVVILDDQTLNQIVGGTCNWNGGCGTNDYCNYNC
jgi:hypothetical protein